MYKIHYHLVFRGENNTAGVITDQSFDLGNLEAGFSATNVGATSEEKFGRIAESYNFRTLVATPTVLKFMTIDGDSYNESSPTSLFQVSSGTPLPATIYLNYQATFSLPVPAPGAGVNSLRVYGYVEYRQLQ